VGVIGLRLIKEFLHRSRRILQRYRYHVNLCEPEQIECFTYRWSREERVDVFIQMLELSALRVRVRNEQK
jgi:adenine C2-methylase RlmN of 23S rRNA A2503 and tRNA A37